MPHTITPVSTFTTTITVPSDGDAVNAAGLDTFVQALANRELWLKDNAITSAGGTVTLTAPLSIQGAFGVTINGVLTTNDANMRDVSCGELEVDDLAEFNSNAVCHASLQVDGNTTLGNAGSDTLTCNAAATFAAAANLNGGGALVGTFTGNHTKSGVTTYSGGGHVRGRPVFGVDANGSYGVDTADVVIIDSETLTTARAYSLTATGAGNGSRIRFINHDATNAVTITPSAGAVTIIRAASGVARWVEYMYSGTTWHVVGIFIAA